MSKTFYDYQEPGEALTAYLETNDTLYNRLKKRSLERFLRKNLHSIRGKDVADVGAGGGIWTRFWLDEGANVTALDLHGPVLEGNKMQNPGAEFIQGDAVTVDMRKKFDIIFSKDLIEHIPDDEVFLRNMAGHLKEEGYLAITTQNSFSLNYLVEGGCYFILRRKWCGWDPTHLRFYNHRSLSRKLDEAGFIPVKFWSTYHFPYIFLSQTLLRRVVEWKGFQLAELLGLNDKFIFNITGWCIGVIARKKS